MPSIDQAFPAADGASASSSAAPSPRRRGFAAMDPAKQREIASLGGRAAHASGHAHEFNTEEARVAGRKRHEKTRTSVNQDGAAAAG